MLTRQQFTVIRKLTMSAKASHLPRAVTVADFYHRSGNGPTTTGGAVLCFIYNSETHFMLPSAGQLYRDADSIFQQDMAPDHTAKGTKSWFNDHGVTVLDWPANSPDLNP